MYCLCVNKAQIILDYLNDNNITQLCTQTFVHIYHRSLVLKWPCDVFPANKETSMDQYDNSSNAQTQDTEHFNSELPTHEYTCQ